MAVLQAVVAVLVDTEKALYLLLLELLTQLLLVAVELVVRLNL